MAYYSSAYSSGSDYDGECNFFNSYAVNYDYPQQVPAFMTYNSHDHYQPYYEYDSSLYFAPNYPNHSYQTIAYSATTFNDPKSIVYDPNYGMTQLVLSYSTLEFNEPAFDEYDPTPYGGGYDIAETYGKPLPPSDKICYPRSGSNSVPISVPFDTPPTGSIVPLPTVQEAVDEKAIKPQNGTEAQTTEEEKPQSQDSTTDLMPYEGEDSEESHHEDDYGSGFGNGYSGGQFDEHEKQVPSQYPSGYGLESLDLCESLFGYWPCLSKMKRRENCCEQVFDRGNNCQENMWKGSADYLFGHPYPYAGSHYGGELVYGYERHNPIQAQYKQMDYTDESW